MILITIDPKNKNRITLAEKQEDGSITGDVTLTNWEKFKDGSLDDILHVHAGLAAQREFPIGCGGGSAAELLNQRILRRKKDITEKMVRTGIELLAPLQTF